jgi:hypothetical protein
LDFEFERNWHAPGAVFEYKRLVMLAPRVRETIIRKPLILCNV